jgi:hypothetical protein
VFDRPSLFKEDRWHREADCKQAGSLKVTESPKYALRANESGSSPLEVSYIRELAEHVYAVRFSYKTPSIRPFSTQDEGLYVHYFADSLYLEASTLARYVSDLLGKRR